VPKTSLSDQIHRIQQELVAVMDDMRGYDRARVCAGTVQATQFDFFQTAGHAANVIRPGAAIVIEPAAWLATRIDG